MAEVSGNPTGLDWTFHDRESFTARWNDANAFNLMARGYKQYKTVRQRAFFYGWFDQIREIQQHDVLWPAAAWIVATQMSNVENPVKNFFLPRELKALAEEGNEMIFNDVFGKLSKLFQDGLKGRALTGKEARAWDAETLQREQYVIVQPIYEKHVKKHPSLRSDLQELASGSGVYMLGGIAIGNALDFSGDIMKPQDRYKHGMQVVPAFYKRFKQVIESGRKRRQRSTPDPSARGRIRYKGV